MARPLALPLLVVLAAVLAVPSGAHALETKPADKSRVLERLQTEVAMGMTFWAARGVVTCPQVTVELYAEPAGSAGRGGGCRVLMNTYWLRPNRWGLSAQDECALVFHEVRHALGAETGGIDGNGHTATGLMTPDVGAVPSECVQWARRPRATATVRYRYKRVMQLRRFVRVPRRAAL